MDALTRRGEGLGSRARQEGNQAGSSPSVRHAARIVTQQRVHHGGHVGSRQQLRVVALLHERFYELQRHLLDAAHVLDKGAPVVGVGGPRSFACKWVTMDLNGRRPKAMGRRFARVVNCRSYISIALSQTFILPPGHPQHYSHACMDISQRMLLGICYDHAQEHLLGGLHGRMIVML